MSQMEEYKKDLLSLVEWEPYLMLHSGLPGPRANLTLLYTVVKMGNKEHFQRFLNFQQGNMSGDSPNDFIVMCGVVGLGKLLAQGQAEVLVHLKQYAADSRWRIRESVAMALQIYGEHHMDQLLSEMMLWSSDGLLVQRAVAAALCEPKLLKDKGHAEQLFVILNRLTSSLLVEENRNQEGSLVLKKALGYCWSVAIAAYPTEGKVEFEQWINYDNKDIRWMLKENLSKNRLHKLDMEWVEWCKDKMA
ncbi:HEAT repeat domain-containing protein [Paenibacillus segetis]|uniref:HEAT repeat-containing protein n=1 Tax=Paenibacillus segetis TaxID=1325360 RepID=A0ABQ1YRD7_9BACL|nr:HEAT repeat domain-containing protein [Paenibacillus segetis]GGH33665.1 hypothetical protein GCM10008013_38920 [Paenibacillus segetis]